MKICHVTSGHNRYDGRIFLKQCSSLAKKYDVILLCCDTLKDEVKNNVKIISINKTFKNVYERMLFSTKYLKKKCIDIDANVYEFHDPELLYLAKYMKRKGKKVIFDSHEDYPALFLEREWIPNCLRRIMTYIYCKYENSVLKKMDYVLCASEHIKNRIIKINKNCEIIPNFPIYEEIDKKEQNIKTFNICFAGSIDKEWNHEIIIKAIQKIDNVKYLIVGNCSDLYKEKLMSIDVNRKVEFLGKLKYEEVKKIYQSSDVGVALCSYRPNVNYKEGSIGITKIFEFMMFKLPVIFTDFKVFKKINNKKQFGISVNPYNEEEVKDAVLKLIHNKKIGKLYGENGHNLVKNEYCWNKIENLLFKIYDKLR